MPDDRDLRLELGWEGPPFPRYALSAEERRARSREETAPEPGVTSKILGPRWLPVERPKKFKRIAPHRIDYERFATAAGVPKEEGKSLWESIAVGKRPVSKFGIWKSGKSGVDVPFPVVGETDELDPPSRLWGGLFGYSEDDPDPRRGGARYPEMYKGLDYLNKTLGGMTQGGGRTLTGALSQAGEEYEEGVSKPFRDVFGETVGNVGQSFGLMTPEEAGKYRYELRENPNPAESAFVDPLTALDVGGLAKLLGGMGKTGSLMRQGMSHADAARWTDHLNDMQGFKPRGGGLGGLLQGSPMDPGRRRILAGGLAAAAGGRLMRGLGRAQGVGEIPKLRPHEAMEAVQRRWHNSVSAPGGFGADPRSLISEDLRLADEALTGRGKGLTYDPQLQIEHNLDELGIHPDYGDVLPQHAKPLRIGQGHAPLTESKIQQVVESAENEQERRALMRFLETNWIPHQEGELGRHEQTLRDLLQGRTKRPKTIAEQQRLESLGDTHFENLTPREQIKLKFADRRSAKERRDISKQTLGDLMRGGPHAVRDARASDARLNNLLRYDRPHEVGTHELSEAVPAMGTELVNPNSPVFSQPMLDNLNAVRMKHNEEAFDVIQKYKSKGGDSFEMAQELKELQYAHGTTLVDSLVDDAVGMMEKRMHALDPKKYAGMHPEDAQELRFNLEQVVQPYGNPAQMGTFYAGDVPKHYPVTPPPAAAPAGAFGAVEPPLIKWLKKRKRGR